MRIWFGFVAAVVVGSSLAGCAIQNTAEREATVENHYSTSRDLLDQQREDAKRHRPFVRIRDRQWVDTTPVVSSKRRLPDAIICSVTYAPQTAAGVYELSQVIQDQCGVTVRLSSDAVDYLWAEDDRTDDDNSGSSGFQGYSPNPGYGSNGATGAAADDVLMRALGLTGDAPLASRNLRELTFTDEPLESLFDSLTAQLGISWRYDEDDGEVVLYHVDTQTFPVHSLSQTTAMNSSVSSGTSLGSTGAEGGGESVATGSSESGQSTTVTLDHDFSTEFRSTVESMLSTYGAYSWSPSTAQLTVTDTPDVLKRVGRYVESENKTLGRQVLLDAKVLSVTLSDSDSLGLDWNLIYQSAAAQVGYQSPFSEMESSAGSASIHLIDGNSRWNSSQILFNALSEQGRVSTVSSPSAVTTNLKPTPLQAARQVGYLARSSVTNIEGGQSSQELVPGTVNIGLNMTAIPYIINDNEMLLQFSLELSSLRDMRTVESGDSRIEIPELDQRIFSQSVRLKNGETLILSGFEQERTNSSRQGMGYARNFLMGGGMSSEKSREVIVIMITPTFMGDQSDSSDLPTAAANDPTYSTSLDQAA